MNARKRIAIIKDTGIENTQESNTKIPRTTEITHTDVLEKNNPNEDKIDTHAEKMNIGENDLATGSADQLNDDEMVNSLEFEQNSNTRDEETDRLQREVDVLLAAISESQRSRDTNSQNNGNDNETTIIIDPTIDLEQQMVDSATGRIEVTMTAPVASTSAQAAMNDIETVANNNVDDSVVLIDDMGPRSIQRRPISNDDEEDVIFVTESRGLQNFRTIATIDLCNSPDTSYIHPTSSNQLNERTAAVQTNVPDAVAVTAPAAPIQSIKCPICLETFGFHEILSTMCGHLYCDPCIRNVIKIRKKCPMCNRGLKQNQVHRIYFET